MSEVSAAEQAAGSALTFADFVPSILVGTFTLVGAIAGTLLANHLEHRREDRRERAEVVAFLRAIRIELLEAWRRYEDAIGKTLQKHEQGPFRGYFIAQQDYMPVYRRSANQLGRITDADVQHAIGRAYIHMKALLDSHQTNLDILAGRGSPGGDIRHEQDRAQLTGVQYAVDLKSFRETTEQAVATAVAEIDRFLGESSKDHSGQAVDSSASRSPSS